MIDKTFGMGITKIFRWAGSKLVYNAFLLYYTLLDKKVSFSNKSMIIAALAYLVFPIDTIPDFIPAIGFSDDLAALIFVIGKVKGNINAEIEKRAKAKTDKLM